jgi:hypothetical protein
MRLRIAPLPLPTAPAELHARPENKIGPIALSKTRISPISARNLLPAAARMRYTP